MIIRIVDYKFRFAHCYSRLFWDLGDKTIGCLFLLLLLVPFSFFLSFFLSFCCCSAPRKTYLYPALNSRQTNIFQSSGGGGGGGGGEEVGEGGAKATPS